MSESTETQAETNVVEVEAEKVEVEVETVDPKKFNEVLKDNHKQREEIRQYKAQLETLTTEFTTLKQTFEAKQEAETKAQRETTLNAALDTAGIVDPKARELATKLLKDSENLEEEIKQVITDYPFMTGKKTITLPDTGKARETGEAIPERQKLSVGLANLMKK